MPTMCSNIARGQLVGDTETFINSAPVGSATQSGVSGQASGSSGGAKATLHDILADFRGSTPFADVLAKHGLVKHGDRLHKHVQEDWFADGPANFWPHNDNKEEVVRHGLAEAIALKIEHNVPIAILWVCAGHHFQVAIHRGAVQITVLILTPHTPHGAGATYSLSEPEDLWVVGPERDIDEIVREASFISHNRRHQNPRKQDCKRLATSSPQDIYRARLYRSKQRRT